MSNFIADPNFLIREAQPPDFAQIAAMEEMVWRKENTPVLGTEHFWAWHKTYPQGFMIAERQGKIVGMICAEIIAYKPDEAFPWPTFDAVTNKSYISGTHQPKGTHHFGLTVCSVDKGAGAPLLEALIALANRTGRPLLGVSRLPGLTAYLNSEAAQESGQSESNLALHYVHTTVTMGNGRVHPRLFSAYNPASCPPVNSPDPTLRRYVRHGRFRFMEFLSNFWHDPPGHDSTVLFMQD